MKSRINARLLEGAKLDKLADGRSLDLGGEIVPAKHGGKKVSRITCDKAPGFFIRLNAKSYEHAFGVITPMRDGVAGKQIIIGKLSEITLDDARATARDWYRNGTPEETRSNDYTLDFCFEKWLAKKNARFDGGALVRINPEKPIKASKRTIDGNRRDLELFSADWRTRSVTDIETKEIIEPTTSGAKVI